MPQHPQPRCTNPVNLRQFLATDPHKGILGGRNFASTSSLTYFLLGTLARVEKSHKYYFFNAGDKNRENTVLNRRGAKVRKQTFEPPRIKVRKWTLLMPGSKTPKTGFWKRRGKKSENGLTHKGVDDFRQDEIHDDA